MVIALVLTPYTAALQAGAMKLQTVQRARATPVVMGEQATKKENEWKYVKSINDYGKEQTYMYLAERESDPDGPNAALGKGLVDLGPWSFLTAPYMLALFAPFTLCAVYIISGKL